MQIYHIDLCFMIYCYQILFYAYHSTCIISLTQCFMRLVEKNCLNMLSSNRESEHLVDVTPVITQKFRDGGRTAIFVQYSSLLFSLAPLTLFCFSPVAHGRPPGRNEGISMLVEFSLINPVCHASFPACLSLPLPNHPSIHPSFSLPLHIYLSVPQVCKLIALSLWEKRQPLGTNTEAPVCQALCFNEKLKPQQSHLHTHKALIHTATHTK